MKIGLTVVVLALMGAILAGSVSFTTSPTLETEYERVSDLAPIVTSSPVTGSEIYNPITNQTGWTDVNFETQTSPSIYSITSTGTYESWTSTKTITGYGGVYYTTTAGSCSADYGSRVLWSDGSNGMVAAENMIGGFSGQTSTLVTTIGTFKATWDVTFGTAVPASDGLFWQDLTHLAITENWSNIIVTTSIGVRVGELQFTSNGNADQKVVSLHVEPDPDDVGGVRYYWDQSRSGWYEITGTGVNNAPLLADNPTSLFWWGRGYDNPSLLTGERFVPGPTTYIVPYSQVTIPEGNTPTWSNGYANARVQIITDPTVTLAASDGTNAATIHLPTEAQSYSKVLITIGASSGDRYWQGITNYVSPTNYSLLEYRYLIIGDTDLNSVSNLAIVSGSSMAYIANTWVPTDPSGLLWQDPTMAPQPFFPDVYTQGARVIFSSILVTGNSLTIDGHTYATADKKITIDGRDYSLNGFAIDYHNGHTYLNTPTGERIDLGVTVSTVITGSGVWYWSAELDSINVTTGEKTDVLFGQAPSSMEWSVFAFIGLIGLCILGLAAMSRESLDGMDWIIMILAAIIALMLVMQ